MVSLSILICTIGRPSLRRMLDSIIDQLCVEDYLYIAIDGPIYYDQTEKILAEIDNQWKCKVIVFKHPKNTGHWGQILRNIYQEQMKGDYIMHADDDDIYVPGAFDIIRNSITEKDHIYIFQMKLVYFNDKIVPTCDEIVSAGIGSPNGVVANLPDLFGRWGCHSGGDFDFWSQTVNKFGHHRIHYIHQVIYHALPH